jgi:aspartate aminotransferase
MDLSPAVRNLKPSATIAAAAKAKALKAQGIKVYDFTLGEPDFNTPAHIQEAAILAMKSGHTHYTPSGGIPELKAAICAAYQRDYGLEYKPNQVVVSNGAKHSIHNVLTTVIGPGDEVIIPAPYWVSYGALVELAGGVCKIVDTSEESGFRLSAEQFRAAITPKTKLLLLNSPCNPTGAVYSRSQLEALAQVALDSGVWVCSDEIYEKLIYTGEANTSFATLLGGKLAPQTIIVSGVSKAYAMTGWRIGWTLAPVDITAGMDNLQSQETSNPCSISQYASIAALSGPQDTVEEMRVEFAKRREYAIERVNGLPGIQMPSPGGAFYAFFNVTKHFGRPLGAKGRVVHNATDFCTALLEDAHVALVTGEAFGAEGFVRLSFATNLDTLKAGFDRINAFLGG